MTSKELLISIFYLRKTCSLRAECEQQVKGFNQAKFKKFPTEEEAETFMKGADGAGQFFAVG